MSGGAEFEARVIPARGLTLGVTANYTDFKYTQYQSGNLDLTPTPQPTPKYTVDLSGRYEIPLGVGPLSLQGRLVLARTGPTAALATPRSPASPLSGLPAPMPSTSPRREYIRAVGTLSARINLHIDRWGMDVALWGKNLTDERYLNGLLAPFGGPPYFTIGFVS